MSNSLQVFHLGLFISLSGSSGVSTAIFIKSVIECNYSKRVFYYPNSRFLHLDPLLLNIPSVFHSLLRLRWNWSCIFLPFRLLPQMQTALSLAHCSSLCLTALTSRTNTLSSQSTHRLESCVSLRISIETQDRLPTTFWSKLKIQWVDFIYE